MMTAKATHHHQQQQVAMYMKQQSHAYLAYIDCQQFMAQCEISTTCCAHRLQPHNTANATGCIPADTQYFMCDALLVLNTCV
jgi:hypothetical protein